MTFESIQDIKALIADLVSSKIDSGQVVNMHWATIEVLNNYSDIEGGDADFYRITAREYVANQVKRSIKAFDPTPETMGGQLVLDGFEHLQKAYPVGSGDDRQLVPVDQVPDEALFASLCEAERKPEWRN